MEKRIIEVEARVLPDFTETELRGPLLRNKMVK